MFIAGGVFTAFAFFICLVTFGFAFRAIGLFLCIILGLASGMVIGKCTEYFTSFDFGPVMSIKDRGITGPATVIIQGLGVGMISCVPPTVILVGCIMACTE